MTTWSVGWALLLGSSLWGSDVLLTHGHIYTGNPQQPWVEGLAITGSRIDVLGSNDAVLLKRTAKSKVVDLQGRTVIPGIIDSHTHMWLGALAIHGFNLATPEVYIDSKSEPELVVKIKEYAAAHPKDKVLYGRVQFANDVTHAVLDRAVNDRPVVIHAPTEHSYWVNGKALELAGITGKALTDPEMEKFIVRDASGQPTGVLKDAAMLLMDRSLPSPPLKEQQEWLRAAAQYLNSFGITSVTNATGSLAEIQLYAALHERGQLPVRVRTAFASVGANHKLTPQFLADLDTARTKYNNDWVSANLVKFFADGAGGPILYQAEEYKTLVRELDKRGYQIMTHAIGAAPARLVLDAYEDAAKANGNRDRRFRMEHAMSVPLADAPRLGKLGVTASVQPEFCCFNDAPGSPSNIWETMQKNGANLAFGSDWPCTWPPAPFAAMQQAVTREVRQLFVDPKTRTGAPKYASPDERVSMEQAVAAYTKGGAYARFSEARIGTLEAGKEADLAVLSQDIFSARPEEIGKTEVVMTMVGGKTVFERSKR